MVSEPAQSCIVHTRGASRAQAKDLTHALQLERSPLLSLMEPGTTLVKPESSGGLGLRIDRGSLATREICVYLSSQMDVCRYIGS